MRPSSPRPCWPFPIPRSRPRSSNTASSRRPTSRNFRATMPNSAPLPPGSTVGILGGGQLGRMLALAAARLGMKTHIFCPDPESPAFDVTPLKTVAAYTDEIALAAFADAADVVTYEFENVPAETAAFLAARKPLR